MWCTCRFSTVPQYRHRPSRAMIRSRVPVGRSCRELPLARGEQGGVVALPATLGWHVLVATGSVAPDDKSRPVAGGDSDAVAGPPRWLLGNKVDMTSRRVPPRWRMRSSHSLLHATLIPMRAQGVRVYWPQPLHR